MRIAAILSLSFPLLLTTAASSADPPRLVLEDEGLSIQEIRPLERHDWILTRPW